MLTSSPRHIIRQLWIKPAQCTPISDVKKTAIIADVTTLSGDYDLDK